MMTKMVSETLEMMTRRRKKQVALIPITRQRREKQMRVGATSMMLRKKIKMVRKKMGKDGPASRKLQTIQRKNKRRSRRSKKSKKLKMTRLVTSGVLKTIVRQKKMGKKMIK